MYTRSKIKKIVFLQRTFRKSLVINAHHIISKLYKKCDFIDPITFEEINEPVVILNDFKLGNYTVFDKSTLLKIISMKIDDYMINLHRLSKEYGMTMSRYVKYRCNCCCMNHYFSHLKQKQICISPMTRQKFSMLDVYSFPHYSMKVIKSVAI